MISRGEGRPCGSRASRWAAPLGSERAAPRRGGGDRSAKAVGKSGGAGWAWSGAPGPTDSHQHRREEPSAAPLAGAAPFARGAKRARKGREIPRAAGAPATLRPTPGKRRGAAPKAAVPNAQRRALGWAAALGPAPSNNRFSGAGRKLPVAVWRRWPAECGSMRRTRLGLGGDGRSAGRLGPAAHGQRRCPASNPRRGAGR